MNKYQLVFPIVTTLCAGMLPTYFCISPLIESLPLSWYLYSSPRNSPVSGNQPSALSSHVDIDLVDLLYEEHYPTGMCVLQDCDCQVDIHFFITYKNVCTNDNAEFYLGYV
jgi:hypothetical protein